MGTKKQQLQSLQGQALSYKFTAQCIVYYVQHRGM